METSVTGQTVIDESVLDSTHSASNIKDNIISSEKAEFSQGQVNGGKPSQNANQLMMDLHMSALQTPEECDHSTLENALNDARVVCQIMKQLTHHLPLCGASMVIEEL